MTDARTPEGVVEAVGFGRAQIVTLVLSAGGLHVCDGMLMTGMNTFARSMGKDFNLGPQARAMMTMVMFIGVFLGTASVGFFSDAFGRRRACLVAYSLCAVFAFLTAISNTYGMLVTVTGFLGIGIGLGFPPSIALLSEMTPARWRIPMRVLSTASYIMGHLVLLGFLALDDPYLHYNRWRLLMLIMSAFPAGLGACAYLWLPESPIFLAAACRDQEAEQTFAWMKACNRVDASISTAYDKVNEEKNKGPGSPRKLSGLQKLQALFAPERRQNTLALGFAIFSIQLTLYGTMYAAPQIMEKASTLVPVLQIFISVMTSLACAMVIGVIAQLIPRRVAMTLACSLTAVVTFLFVMAGSKPKPRSALTQMLFQVGANGGGFTVQLAMVVGLQLSVELFPVEIATTGSSFVGGLGRFGAVVAPQLFEALQRVGNWTHFYYLLVVLLILGSFAAALIRPPAEEVREVKGKSYGGCDSKA